MKKRTLLLAAAAARFTANTPKRFIDPRSIFDGDKQVLPAALAAVIKAESP